MSSGKRSRNVFDPQSKEPFKLSRSKLENFLKCPRCFYLDRRLGIPQLRQLPFTLNIAVDHLLKKEFDVYRAKGEPHPLMKANGVNAVPFQHPDLDIWRENFKGIQYHHKPTNLIITGAVDDVWQTPMGKLIIVDYKATSTDKEINLDDEWKIAFKRQMEIYQWLFRQSGFKVLNTGYFVYVNASKSRPTFDGHLHFDVHLLPHKGDDSWVEPAILEAKKCLMNNTLPEPHTECEPCAYRRESQKYEVGGHGS
ncbi:MAG: hypothetical protein A2W61_01185 [Deltaproteobacteria bacterium RIFCSPLOWO2_01_44_7]|nr:MAG: hypothetical protein A2712_00625 [Deltaproteobacteria bacterium RIFCSPHIGHO2_01_FULL_43_49]OGQ14221.1 MAG: hypothetical protein A3D22_09990 [Deltaproteobacteria bacterium RIFCSPHIGHO2_02_FULL_44_53]OGQ27437.1 MAG: hypothetical protein A3D98_03590 [Deltaproteobacteria bacterium RIFCSPHIGHO2_12_FULL_44_21]OGQ30685.1 MAG: hypothetical protein A2979_06015 [Deltaproteobacteria bacterium RIFCSPLOWO2_01_FULL_45_74]OGQ37726.1 MAG: hypothetical protein A2W61_01185 [Deltaproteobacteria bacterium 